MWDGWNILNRVGLHLRQEMSIARECHDGNSLAVHNDFYDAHCLVCERMNAITADNKKEMVGQ